MEVGLTEARLLQKLLGMKAAIDTMADAFRTPTSSRRTPEEHLDRSADNVLEKEPDLHRYHGFDNPPYLTPPTVDPPYLIPPTLDPPYLIPPTVDPLYLIPLP
ncbi:hypothetical protein EYF80_052445 [Liparis tanakae]|uniref:Uncharacterized protein n=1 Tax=Liparis tanakae TaxID=230148 RepID=A0A4Z2F899_9TELE|nr:hypothetical protein EYF80_052445 [Liparis tanakae]